MGDTVGTTVFGILYELVIAAASRVSLSGLTCAAVFTVVSLIEAAVCKSVDAWYNED